MERTRSPQTKIQRSSTGTTRTRSATRRARSFRESAARSETGTYELSTLQEHLHEKTICICNGIDRVGELERIGGDFGKSERRRDRGDRGDGKPGRYRRRQARGVEIQQQAGEGIRAAH